MSEFPLRFISAQSDTTNTPLTAVLPWERSLNNSGKCRQHAHDSSDSSSLLVAACENNPYRCCFRVSRRVSSVLFDFDLEFSLAFGRTVRSNRPEKAFFGFVVSSLEYQNADVYVLCIRLARALGGKRSNHIAEEFCGWRVLFKESAVALGQSWDLKRRPISSASLIRKM